MKKLTILLLFPLFSFGQMPTNYIDISGRKEIHPVFIERASISVPKAGVYYANIKIPESVVLAEGGGGEAFFNGQWIFLPAPQTDSLWTESPAIKDASTVSVTVGEEITTSAGRLKAIKFWKNELNGNYIITLYQQSSGASLFSQSYRSTTTGWQRLTFDWPLEAGTYVISVYYPNGKYVYTNGFNPRTRGKLTGNSGLFAGGNNKPSARYTASFFVDAVISYEEPRKPLIVNAGKDTTAIWPADSIKVFGVISGDEVKYTWEVLNQWNGVTVTGLTTLSPVVKFTEPDSGVQMLLTGTDKWGNTSWHGVNVSVMPDFEPMIKRMSELIINELRFEMRRKWKAGE